MPKKKCDMEIKARFFINSNDAFALKAFALKGWPSRNVVVGIIPDPTLPDREPEAFKDKYEILIREV